MSSTENQNHLAASKMLFDTIVSFKPNSELKKYIQHKTKISKTFFTLGEITTILRIIIGQEKQYEERNPAVIICSEELKLALNCDALHVSELKDKIISHLAFASEYLRDAKSPSSYFPTGKCIATSIWTPKKAQFKLKTPFCELIQKVKKVNKNRTIFTYEEICSSLSNYINDRRIQFFHGKNRKIAWVHDDPLGICFNVSSFHVIQVKMLLRSQLIPFKARQSSRRLNKNK